jgi:hypothetical protein
MLIRKRYEEQYVVNLNEIKLENSLGIADS